MQFTSGAILSIALAFSASAAPLVADTPPSFALEERQAQQLWSVSCNTNTQTKGFDRKPILEQIAYYCNKHVGEHIKDDYAGAMDGWDLKNGYSIKIGPQGKMGCDWYIDDLCDDMLKMPIDECNKEGENNKKGGKYDDQCATWTLEFSKN